MLIIVHSLWGLALATQTQNFILLLFGGIGGHILLDAIPHLDLTTVRQVIVDIFCAFTISLIFIRIFSLPLIFAWSVLFSTLPDIDVALHYYGLWKKLYFPSHLSTWHGILPSPYRELTNAIVGLLLLILFLIGVKRGV